MREKKDDRRIQRTRTLLHEALLDLIIEKGYEPITIQNIIDRANIGRSTFYTHFVDKEDLLKSIINQLFEFLYDQGDRNNETLCKGAFRFRFSYAFLQHVQGHRLLYKATVGKQSGAVVIHHMKHMLANLATKELEVLLSMQKTLPVEVVIEFLVNSLLTLINWWMNNEMPCSAKEVDQMFHDLTLKGRLASLLGGDRV